MSKRAGTGYFEEGPGVKSIMRVISFMIVSAGLFIILLQAIRSQNIDWIGCISLISSGLVGKIGQKHQENSFVKDITLGNKPKEPVKKEEELP